MSKFYFNIREGDMYLEDLDGVELADANAAYTEGILAAREMLAEQVLRGEMIDGQRFEITGADGKIVATIPFRSVLKLEP